MSQSQPPQQASPQQQQRVRKPPLADWPTIKILTPPQGRFSPKIDEWCLTYCSQSIGGRIHGKEPNCRSICIRKVFPHEVRNIISFKRHRNVDADGIAKYPLPSEGQTTNLPRLLGGQSPADPDDDRPTPPKPSTRYWGEGWYLWTTTSRKAAQEKTNMMMLDLEKQQKYAEQQEQRKEIWQDYQDQLKQTGADKEALMQQFGGKWSSSIISPNVPADQRAQSLLVHLPPDLPPIWERINKLLTPTYHALNILRESIASGEQKQFALRIWEKAQTDEPFILARRTCSQAYERWRERDATDEDDGKKGST